MAIEFWSEWFPMIHQHSMSSRPPDVSDSDIKGEYIEDCDDIKEESSEANHPAMPAMRAREQNYHFPMSAPVPPLQLHHAPHSDASIPPSFGLYQSIQRNSLQQSLSPLELIQRLSSYASNRKQMSSESRSQSGFHTQNISHSIQKLEKFNSYQSTIQNTRKISQNKQKETNNNANNKRDTEQHQDSDVSDLTQSSKSMIDCPVCGDIAVAHFHYGGMCCYSCKAFFRRVVNTNKVSLLLKYWDEVVSDVLQCMEGSLLYCTVQRRADWVKQRIYPHHLQLDNFVVLVLVLSTSSFFIILQLTIIDNLSKT